MIGAALKADIERHAGAFSRDNRLLALARRGEIGAVTVAEYLVNIRYLLSRTPVHTALAARRCDEAGERELASFFRGKGVEETGHDRWADDDLRSLGADGAPPGPGEPMRALVEFLRLTIEADPVRYLAYVLFAEHFTVLVGPEWIRALDEGCGIPASAMTAIGRHVELDQGHVAAGVREIDRLLEGREVLPDLLDTLHGAMARFDAFCDDLAARVPPPLARPA